MPEVPESAGEDVDDASVFEEAESLHAENAVPEEDDWNSGFAPLEDGDVPSEAAGDDAPDGEEEEDEAVREATFAPLIQDADALETEDGEKERPY